MSDKQPRHRSQEIDYRGFFEAAESGRRWLILVPQLGVLFTFDDQKECRYADWSFEADRRFNG